MSLYFDVCFGVHQYGKAVPPPKILTTETVLQSEFWQKLDAMEKEVSKRLGYEVFYLTVISNQDIPECKIRKGEIVAWNSLEL